jgi:hypothetical protein
VASIIVEQSIELAASNRKPPVVSSVIQPLPAPTRRGFGNHASCNFNHERQGQNLPHGFKIFGRVWRSD